VRCFSSVAASGKGLPVGTLATREQSAAIRGRMESIRSNLPYDMDDARDELKQLADWRYYVSKLPLASLAAGAVVGYLLVPSKSTSQRKATAANKEAVEEEAAESSFVGGLLGSVAAMALRTATTLAVRQVSNTLFNQSQQPPTQASRQAQRY